MTHQLFLIVGEYGLAVVFFNVLVDQIGIPVPAVPTLIVAGAIAANGNLPFGRLFACAVVACLLADCGWYVVGRRHGIRVLKILCRISLEPDSCVSQTQIRFERWGVNSLLIAKFVPGLAIIAPPLAGALAIGWPRFIALSGAGAMLWVGSGLIAGAVFRSQIEALLIRLDDMGEVVGTVLGCALVAYLAYKWWARARFLASLRMARISVGGLHELIQAGAAPLIIDVRSVLAHALEPKWIPGALHVPIDQVATRMRSLPREREIILYCACPSEASAARVARILMKNGFGKVRPLDGGLEAWIAAGYAVDSATEPEPVIGSLTI